MNHIEDIEGRPRPLLTLRCTHIHVYKHVYADATCVPPLT